MKNLVVIPTYNEIENITKIVPEIFAAVPEISILVVDDNSPDKTGDAVLKMAEQYPQLHLLSRPGKQGLGKAYLAGFAWGFEKGFDVIVEMDADFSHRPRDLVEILSRFPSHDFVVGSRYVPGGATVNWGLLRKIISRGGGFYSRMILGFPLNDWTGGFNAWKREVLEKIGLGNVKSEGYSFQIELKYRALKLGFKGCEAPIVFEDRRVGQSKMSLKIVLEAFYRVWLLKFLLVFFIFSSIKSVEAQEMGSFHQPSGGVAIAAAPTSSQAGKAPVKVRTSSPSGLMPKEVQKGTVIADSAQVYQTGDFDAPVIALVTRGQVYDISMAPVGPFYTIRLRPGVIGYISDIDIRPGNLSAKLAKGAAGAAIQAKTAEPKPKSRSIGRARYRGLGLEQIAFSEDTMGALRSENLLFYGIKISGENTLIAGPMYVDFSLLFHNGAPAYYKKQTGQASYGWITMGQFLFETAFPESPIHMWYIGFGPLIKVSHFDVSVAANDQVTNYALDDISGGVVFNLGLAFKVSSLFSFRTEAKYYIERTRYSAVALGLQSEF